MGCYCRICERVRPNEKFSGKGHRTHVCKDCRRLPKEEREKIELTAELSGFLRQSRISKKNVKRLQELTTHSDAKVARQAGLLIQVAKIAEGKRKRWRKVSQTDKALLIACGEAGLLENWIPEDEYRANRGPLEDDDGLEDWEYKKDAVLLETDDLFVVREEFYPDLLEWPRDRDSRPIKGPVFSPGSKNSSEDEEIPF